MWRMTEVRRKSGNTLYSELWSDFSNIVPEELPELPPMWDSKHAINLVHGSVLSNSITYQINLTENTEIKKQVDELY